MRRLLALAIVVAGAVAALAIYTFGWRDDDGDQVPRAGPAPVGPHVYVGRQGDVFRVPATGTRCLVSQEGGAANLICTHVSRGRHQVYFYEDRIQVWRNGNPDRGPIFSARP
jgi:hypothetical protein